MKTYSLSFLFSVFSLMICFAQQKVTGEYFIQSSQGEIVLKLQYTTANKVIGTMVDANGVQYQLQGEDEEGDVFGIISNASGSTYFEAYREDNQLMFTIIPPGPDQQPDHSKGQEFAMTYRGGGSTNFSISQNEGIAGVGRSNEGSLGGPVSSTGSSTPNAWDGNFNGNIAGTHSILSLTQKANQITGKIDAGGYVYNLQGKINGKNAQGQINDPQTGGSMAFQASLQGSTINLTMSGNGQQFTVPFSKGANNQGSIGSSQFGGNNNTANSSVDPSKLDQRIVGNWLYTESNSGGGFSFAAQWRLIIQPNGRYIYGDGKIAGGNGGISASSGGGEVQSQGQWKTENKIIYINEGAGWQAFARYYVEGASMMFTFGDGSKQVWKRTY